MERPDLLLAGERVDDLQRNGLKIIQHPKRFCFGMDAVLLSGFAKAFPREKVVDLCCGGGVIPLLMSARFPDTTYTGIEIQPEIADMASRSVQLNQLDERIRIINGDLREMADVQNLIRNGHPQVVTVNPPYMQAPEGKINQTEAFSIARHEITCSLTDVVECAAHLLQTKGRFYMVHRPARLAQILETMHHFRLEPKRLRFVFPKAGADSNIILIEGIKDAAAQMKVLPPLMIYGPDGNYTAEVRQIYEGQDDEQGIAQHV